VNSACSAGQNRVGPAKTPVWGLAVGWLTLFVVGTDLFVVSPLLPLIAGEFGLSAASAGFSVTLFSLTYMLAAPACGALADRIGRRRVLTCGLLAFAGANLLTAASPGFAWLIASRIAAGAAAASVSPLVYAAIGEAAPAARRATWMAIAVSGLLLALSVGAPIGALLGAAEGWRQPFLLLAGFGIALAIANRTVWPADPPGAAASAADAKPLGMRLLAERLAPTVLWATALYGVYTYLGIGLSAAGFSPAQIARAISLYGVGALAGALLGGQAADRLGTRRTMLAGLVGLAGCVFALGFNLRTEWAADVVLLLASLLAQLFFPAQQASLARDFPARRATILAWNNSALFLGISLGALCGGEVVVHAGFAADTVLCAVIACAAIAAAAARPGRIAKITDDFRTRLTAR
jgi:predicted MFS family arabinose efflux permease